MTSQLVYEAALERARHQRETAARARTGREHVHAARPARRAHTLRAALVTAMHGLGL